MNQSDFLFAKPSFVGGLASVLDLGSTLVVYNDPSSPEIADAQAIESDWTISGSDMVNAMAQWQNEQHGSI